MNHSIIRPALSGLIAFGFYFAWAYWANSSRDIPTEITIRTAIVQGAYSGLVTLVFTLMLDYSMQWIKKLSGNGLWCAPLPPLVLQSIFVVLINVLNQTPNLWLTVAPSIIFSAIYGYGYVYAVTARPRTKT